MNIQVIFYTCLSSDSPNPSVKIGSSRFNLMVLGVNSALCAPNLISFKFFYLCADFDVKHVEEYVAQCISQLNTIMKPKKISKKT